MTPASIDTTIQRWVDQPQNTARSVLVTIFGDTLIPVTSRVWLAQLFQLTDTFGFSARLVRTSLSRLTAEGWFTTERIGRQSQYSLTPLALEESHEASERIYRSSHPDWSGSWTVLFVDSPLIPSPAVEQLQKHLSWQGFISLARGVLGSPTISLQQADDICQRLLPDVQVPRATLDFANLESIVADGFFAQALNMEALEKSYDEFIDHYQPLARQQPALTAQQAFAMRTTLVHDLRRIRLGGPDIPAALLPETWSGSIATTVAANLYPRLSQVAAPWLSEVLAATYPTAIAHRFS